MNIPNLKVVVKMDSTVDLQVEGKKPYQCVICYKTTTFATENVCKHCSKLFTYQAGEISLKETPHQCDICGKRFSQCKTLNGHIKKHHPLEKSNNNESANPPLKQEKFHHLGPPKKQIKCDVCSKYFGTNAKLKRHQQIHTGKYKCNICLKNLSCKLCLTNHQRIHTGEKRYQCQQCGKKYFSINGLKFHANGNKCIRSKK